MDSCDHAGETSRKVAIFREHISG